MTYEEFERWVPQGMHGEWWDGEGIIFVPPTEEHQWGALFLAELIGAFSRIFGLGRVMIAPFEMRPTVGTPRVIFAASPSAENPPIASEPCPTA